MSVMIRASKSPLAARCVVKPVQSRSFMVSSVRSLKETTRDNPDQGQKYEYHKQDQISKQKEGKNFWKPELASESEESVAADRHEKRDLNELQKQTKDQAEKNLKEGTSQNNGFDN